MLEKNSDPATGLIKNPETFKRIDGIDSRSHAKDLDKTLGYKIPKVEVKLLKKYRPYYQSPDDSNKKQHYQGAQTWIGLHPQVLQTPYNDLYEALEILENCDIEKVIDIGAGYGRVGVVMNCIFPDAEFVGYEILSQREEEGNRMFDKLELDNCKILLKDVLEDDFVLPKAQIYFIYDFSEINDICKILDILSDRINDYNFFLITKGDRIDHLIEKKYKHFWIANGFLKSSGSLKIYSSITDLRNI